MNVPFFPSCSLFPSQECVSHDDNNMSSSSPSPKDVEDPKEDESSNIVKSAPSTVSLTLFPMISKPLSPNLVLTR